MNQRIITIGEYEESTHIQVSLCDDEDQYAIVINNGTSRMQSVRLSFQELRILSEVLQAYFPNLMK